MCLVALLRLVVTMTGVAVERGLPDGWPQRICPHGSCPHHRNVWFFTMVVAVTFLVSRILWPVSSMTSAFRWGLSVLGLVHVLCSTVSLGRKREDLHGNSQGLCTLSVCLSPTM